MLIGRYDIGPKGPLQNIHNNLHTVKVWAKKNSQKEYLAIIYEVYNGLTNMYDSKINIFIDSYIIILIFLKC